jgi:transglutaminase-like putative cysteine protease
MAPWLAQRLDLLATNLVWDARSIAAGGSVWATTAAILLSGLLLWVVAFWASWHIYRTRSPLLALLPAGSILATLAYRHASIIYHLFLFLGCALCLLAAYHLWASRERWERTRTDHPDQLGLELVYSVAPWILVLLLVAGVFPTKGFGPVSRAFWDRVESVVGPFDGQGETDESGSGDLPQAHLLGSGPRRLDNIVMYVRTNDPAPREPTESASQSTVPMTRRYWRGDTLDQYTGSGWLSSPLVMTEVPTTGLLVESQAGGAYLLQRFELLADTALIYAANAPQQVDQDVQAWWRSPGDLGRLTSSADLYSVISKVPEADVSRLRASPGTLPDWVKDRYLALPEGIPARVLDLAWAVAGDADTHYDKAVAIETFLRDYTYSLDLPAAPAERDVVDYFLFELQEGYCDYYASAMVVMTRALGVPARFATGFAQGEYQPNHDRWLVKQKDAHSWVEVYFDGVGWVDFEPTAGLPALSRTGEDARVRPAVPGIPDRSIPWQRSASRVLVVALAVLVAGVVLYAVVGLGRRRVQEPGDLVLNRYLRLLRWGERLDAPLQGGQTPNEYATTLGKVLGVEGQESRWSRTERVRKSAQTGIEDLTQAYTFARYSTKPLVSSQVEAIRLLWVRLRRDLLWLWMFKGRA